MNYWCLVCLWQAETLISLYANALSPPPLRSAAVVHSACVFERCPRLWLWDRCQGGEGGGRLCFWGARSRGTWLRAAGDSVRLVVWHDVFLLRCSNNIALESGEKYILNEDGSELTIKDVKKLDEGDYACIAKNKAGMKTEEVSLNVFGRRWF